MKTKYIKFALGVILCLTFNVAPIFAQVITWGNNSPAVSSNNITTCSEIEQLSINFINSGISLVDGSIEVQLDEGIHYIPGSLIVTSGPASIAEFDITDTNRPVFSIGALAAAEEVLISIDRSANCEAREKKIAGGTFADIVHVYESGVEVTYSNGSAAGTGNYDIIYGVLSITGANTTPPTNNLGGSSSRSVTITNGSFGDIEAFYFADIFNAGDVTLSNFIINPTGINYIVPAGNISMVGDSVIIQFTDLEIMAIDGSGGTTGDGDALFEIDEQFELTYDVSPNNCGLANNISSELITWWGCSYHDRCQIAESAANLGLTNGTPAITLSEASRPALDVCDTVTYSIKLTNTSTETTPAGGSFAADVTAFLGFRANATPISTLTNVRMWGSSRYNNKHFVNHQLNGVPITLPLIAGYQGSMLPYLPPDYFTTDPDGPGGLDDIDGDGFYDDLAKDESLVISYGVYNTLSEPACGTGRADYGRWEHISADISWYNQCGVLMSPIRQEFNYTNFIRNYLNSTFIDAPTDISDQDTLTVGIRPHLSTGYTCNGSSAYSSPDMDWIVSIPMPSGFSMKPGYDPNIFTVSGDTVSVTSKYSYSWTLFPLEFNCADWDGTNPIVLPFQTTYVCKQNGVECYREDMHCYEQIIIPHCPSPCVGVTPINFDVKRISESWTDNTQTALVDIDDPAIETDFVYPYDTVAFMTDGIMVDTMTDNLFIRFTYAPENGGDIFEYLDGEITIIDIDGQYNGGTTNYTFPLTGNPTINALGGNDFEAIFDISAYAPLIDPNYEYGASQAGPPTYDADSIKFVANYVIKNTITPVAKYNVNNLRASYFMYDANGDEVTCNSWGTQLSYEKVGIWANDHTKSHAGCGSVEQYFYLIHQALTDDDHPNEYRPPIQLDSAVMSIPLGWNIGNVHWINGSLMSPTDYDLRADRTLILRRPASWNDWDKANTFSPRFQVEMIPTCETPSGKSYFDYTAYLKEFAYLTNTANHVPLETTRNGGFIDYVAPTMTLTPLNQSAPAYQDTISWTIRVCNSTSNMDVPYNWLLLNNNSGSILVDSVLDVTNGGSSLLSTTTTNSGELYFEIGDLNQGTCKDMQIFAQFNSCEIDTLNISQGWGCNAYPSSMEATACGIQSEVYVLPQDAQISTTVTSLPNTPTDPSNPTNGNYGLSTVDMCTEFPAEMQVVNAQPGFLYDIIVNVQIPSGGSGVSYIPGSATIEVEGIDAVGVPRPIGAVAEAALVAASNSSSPIWFGNLSEIDPTNFGNGEPLPGTENVDQNEFIIRWKMQANCDLISGDHFATTVYGNEPCGGPAQGNGEQVNGYPININGVTSPYYSFFTTTLTPNTNFTGCSDSKTINVDLLITSGTTGTKDTLLVTLPNGIDYNGNFVCNTPTKCPTYIGTTTLGGQKVAQFSYPSGQSGTINFDFDFVTDTRGTCGANEILNLKNKTTLSGIPCPSGSNCTNSDVITGQKESSISLEKPILDISILEMTTTNGLTPNTFTYELELTNGGTPTEKDVIVEFYCLNAAGDDISGPAIAKDTLTNILPTNGFETLSGEFTTVCDPSLGVAAMIVPEYDNCYCDALENMTQRVGFNLPFDSLVSVPLPIELIDFSVKDNGCNLIVTWETKTETNNKNFHIQRSDDNLNFQTIAILKGQGTYNLGSKYRHVDQIEAKDKQLFYRLKTTSLDGEENFSKVISLLPKNCGEEVGDFLSIYPNPVKNGNEVSVVYENESYTSVANLKIISMLGVVVIDYDIENLESGINNFNVDLSKIPGGNYFLQLENSEGRFSRVKLSVMKE